jgi:molybdopterin-guanine dinucleotide biosynthesis protein A
MYDNYSAVILAGGANKRFGGYPKSKIKFDGESIISMILGTIRGLFSEIIIVTNTPDEYDNLGIKLTGDHFRNIGPLGGIHAAMLASSSENLFVLASDMPLINKEAILKQVDYFEKGSCDILVAKSGDLMEPLHAIYRKSLLPAIEEYILAGESRSLWKFFSLVNTGYIDFGSRAEAKNMFVNVNSPEDAALVIEILLARKRMM